MPPLSTAPAARALPKRATRRAGLAGTGQPDAPGRGESRLMAVHNGARAKARADDRLEIRPQFARPGESTEVPRFDIPDGEMSPETAYQIIHDELMLDGNARLNLATFVTTWMEPPARVLMAECFDKNMIDKDEYPQTAELEMRSVNMLARLWGASRDHTAVGCSTTGSSEAAMLG